MSIVSCHVAVTGFTHCIWQAYSEPIPIAYHQQAVQTLVPIIINSFAFMCITDKAAVFLKQFHPVTSCITTANRWFVQLLQHVVNLTVEEIISARKKWLENTGFSFSIFVRVAVALHHLPLTPEMQDRLTDVLPAGWKEEHLGQAQIRLKAFVRAAIAIYYCRMTHEGKAEFVAILPTQYR